MGDSARKEVLNMRIIQRELASYLASHPESIDTGIRTSGQISMRRNSNLYKAMLEAQALHPGLALMYCIGGRAGPHKTSGYQLAIVAGPTEGFRHLV